MMYNIFLKKNYDFSDYRYICCTILPYFIDYCKLQFPKTSFMKVHILN